MFAFGGQFAAAYNKRDLKKCCACFAGAQTITKKTTILGMGDTVKRHLERNCRQHEHTDLSRVCLTARTIQCRTVC